MNYAEELFESFLRFLHDYPELKLDHLEASFVCKFLKFIMADGSTFADNLRRLSNAYEYRLLSCLISSASLMLRVSTICS